MRSSTSSAAACTLAMLMVVMLAQQAEAGVEFVLGGKDVGWTNKANIDYNQWMSSYKFKLGDVLAFSNLDSTDHTVVVVDKLAYDTCGKSGEKYSSTTTVSPGYVSLQTPLESGDYYFICDISSHCIHGQKVYVQVLNKDGSVNTTTTPSQGPPGSANTAPQMPGSTWTSQLVIVVVSAFSLMAAAASM